MGSRLRTVIVSVVLVTWACGLIIPMVFRGFTLDPVYVNTLNGAFMAVVGLAAMSYNEGPRRGGENTENPRRQDEARPDGEETPIQ